MTDPKRLTDSELASVLSDGPEPQDGSDPKQRITKRTCPLCREGLVTPLVAEAYLAAVGKLIDENGDEEE